MTGTTEVVQLSGASVSVDHSDHSPRVVVVVEGALVVAGLEVVDQADQVAVVEVTGSLVVFLVVVVLDDHAAQVVEVAGSLVVFLVVVVLDDQSAQVVEDEETASLVVLEEVQAVQVEDGS